MLPNYARNLAGRLSVLPRRRPWVAGHHSATPPPPLRLSALVGTKFRIFSFASERPSAQPTILDVVAVQGESKYRLLGARLSPLDVSTPATLGAAILRVRSRSDKRLAALFAVLIVGPLFLG